MDAHNKSALNEFFLEDLRVGQRFSSGSHMIDEAQIKASQRNSIPSRFILTMKPRRPRCSADWPRAAGTPPRSR